MKLFHSIKLVCIALLLLTSVFNAHAQKMSASEIIAKHLDSIGTKEARDKVQNQLVVGNVQINIKGSANALNGKALILSSVDKTLWAMNLASNDYQQERFGFNGKETKVSFARPGAYSDLGRFINSYRELVKEGLLGGTLASSWALLNTDTRNAKISYEGTKKIDVKETYVLSYTPKGGSDLMIKMFFDKQNFQHIRTEYSRVIGAQMGTTVDNSASQGETRYSLVEQFSDFQKTKDLTLPGKYKLSYSYYNSTAIQQATNSNRDVELRLDLTNFSFNDPLEANSFDITGN